MHFQKFLPLVLACGVASAIGCQLVASPFLTARQKAPAERPVPKPQTNPLASKEFDAYRLEVSRKFASDDFAWIDSEARELRLTKQRLPGGSFKLRPLYRALEDPPEPNATAKQWEDHFARLERWVKQDPLSLTARVGLGSAWTNYAWEARGDNAGDVNESDMEAFAERLVTAAKILNEASSLDERCPEWYVAALRVGIGQHWDRAAFDRTFLAAVELDPNYYYVYQAKAIYLLPRWYGQTGESERFAEESARNVGGPQGDIIFFAIYSRLLALKDKAFVATLHQVRGRLLDAFGSIDKLYGSTPHVLNEVCYFSYGSIEYQRVAELFNRLGENYDPTVWGSKENFDFNRKSALDAAKLNRGKRSSAGATNLKRRNYPQITPITQI